MSILLDTNLLLRLAEKAHPHREAAYRAIGLLLRSRERLIIFPQNLYEFWAVATRPKAVGGLGMSAQDTKAEVDRIRASFALLSEHPDLLVRWLSLVIDYDCKGKPSHDARLVAAMQLHKLDTILTFNKPDFSRFEFLKVLHPDEVY